LAEPYDVSGAGNTYLGDAVRAARRGEILLPIA